jgi:hypothetical protein
MLPCPFYTFTAGKKQRKVLLHELRRCPKDGGIADAHAQCDLNVRRRKVKEGESGGKVIEGDLGEGWRVDFGKIGLKRGGEEGKSGRDDGGEVGAVEGVGGVERKGKDWEGEEEVRDLEESPVGEGTDVPTKKYWV